MSQVSEKFKVGDKVVRTAECEADYTVEQGGVYTVSKVDDEGCCVIFLEGIYNKDSKPDWFNPRNFKLVEEETMFEQTTEQTQNIVDVPPKTPYQEKGYTENSLFKFVGDDGEFEEGEIIKLHYDDGSDIPDFKSISRNRSRYCFLYEDVEYIGEEGAEDMIPDYEEATVKGIVSDGGASDYYFTKLPQHIIDSIVITGGIEIKDIARYVYDNDADAFNIIKAEKRIIEERKGKGKVGCTALYDANKIVYFANEQYEAIKHTEESHG